MMGSYGLNRRYSMLERVIYGEQAENAEGANVQKVTEAKASAESWRQLWNGGALHRTHENAKPPRPEIPLRRAVPFATMAWLREQDLPPRDAGAKN
jgi:hypothetical protein